MLSRKSCSKRFLRDVVITIFLFFLLVVALKAKLDDDIEDDTRFDETEGYPTGGRTHGVVLYENYAYVIDSENGLVILNISDPTNPQYTGGFYIEGSAYDVAVSGDYAFIANSENGLIILNISDPTNPQYTGKYDTEGRAFDLTISGDYVYIADEYNGLVIVDISDPRNPQYAGGYKTPHFTKNIMVSGDFAYVSYGHGWRIDNVSDPGNPQYVGGYDTYHEARGITVNGNYVYVTSGYFGFMVFDVSIHSDPHLVGEYKTRNHMNGIVVNGDYAYLANGNNELVIFDISDPTYLHKIGRYYKDEGRDGHYAELTVDITIWEDHAFLSDLHFGLVIVNLSDYDRDGVENQKDAYPNNPDEWKDTDGDNVGDNSDFSPSLFFIQTDSQAFYLISLITYFIYFQILVRSGSRLWARIKLEILIEKQEWLVSKGLIFKNSNYKKAESEFLRGNYRKSKYYSKKGIFKAMKLEKEYRSLLEGIEVMKEKLMIASKLVDVSKIQEKALSPSIHSLEQRDLKKAREHLNMCKKMHNDIRYPLHPLDRSKDTGILIDSTTNMNEDLSDGNN